MQSGAPITCRECGRENDAGSMFCSSCGAGIDGVCRSCGHENESGSNFCNSCGQSLAGRAGAGLADVARGPGGSPRSASTACPRCHRQNEPLSKFCYHCGLPFEGYQDGSLAVPSHPAFASGRPAGFWARLGAFIIDAVVLTVALAFVLPLFGSSLPMYFDPEDIGQLVSFVLHHGYFILLVGAFSTTIGKRAMNMYVLRPDGARAGYCRALGRQLATCLSLLMFGVGYWMIAFRSDKRGLHDLIAGTIVVMR